jgi:hypothetical protein
LALHSLFVAGLGSLCKCRECGCMCGCLMSGCQGVLLRDRAANAVLPSPALLSPLTTAAAAGVRQPGHAQPVGDQQGHRRHRDGAAGECGEVTASLRCRYLCNFAPVQLLKHCAWFCVWIMLLWWVQLAICCSTTTAKLLPLHMVRHRPEPPCTAPRVCPAVHALPGC